MHFSFYKRVINVVLDIILGTLAVIVIFYMIRHLYDLVGLVFMPVNPQNFSTVMQEITSFFMLFEFVIMLVRYNQEGHHIPIRYLILISMTAILRQLLVIHEKGTQTLLLALSILLLAAVLMILSKFGEQFHEKPKK